MHHRLLAVHADVRFGAEILLLALSSLMHRGIALAAGVLGRRGRVNNRRVHDGAGRIRMPFVSRSRLTVISIWPHRSCCSSRWRKRRIVVSSGAAVTPRSTPAKRRSTADS